MHILAINPIKIESWKHLPMDRFMGSTSDNGYNYILGLSSEDTNEPTCCYFNVFIEKKIVNNNTNEIVFYSKTLSVFKIKNNFQKPTPEFLFKLIDKATFDFVQVYANKTSNTHLKYHRIQKIQFDDIYSDIRRVIDVWHNEVRNSAYVTPLNWQINFGNLPEIPLNKRWVKGSYSTVEQDIFLKKLSQNKEITKEEELIIEELNNFYEELDSKLMTLNYSSFTKHEFENFINYIHYAFNYTALLENDLTVFEIYRLVINEDVSGKNESIENVDFLKYPKISVVKKNNRFNRANTPETNIFYGSENIDTLLKEIRPKPNKLVTVGLWKPKNVNKKLISYPISHSDLAIEVSASVQKANQAFEANIKDTNPLLLRYLRHYFKLLGREYTKKISHHHEYLISALFSEDILKLRYHNKVGATFKFDCIIYPSVGNEYKTRNLAILPEVLDQDFELVKAIEFVIDEQFYDLNCISLDPESINLAKIKNKRLSKQIIQNRIIW